MKEEQTDLVWNAHSDKEYTHQAFWEVLILHYKQE